MSDKTKRILLLLEIVLCLATVVLLWLTWNIFLDALRGAEQVAEGELGWENALHTVEDYQWKSGLVGTLFGLCPAIFLGSGAVALSLRRKGKSLWWAGCILNGSMALVWAGLTLTVALEEGLILSLPFTLAFGALFLFCLHHVR